MRPLNALFPLVLFLPGVAMAHGDSVSRWGALPADLFVLAPLGLAGIAYAQAWRHAPRARRIDAACFVVGCVALCAALVWPLEEPSDRSLAAHMGQHLVLMAIAAPLLVLGLPVRVLLTAVVARASPRRRRCWIRMLRRAVDARWLAVLQTAVLVVWHLPGALAAALESDAMHLLMHASLLAVALPFWAAVLRAGTREGASLAAAALLLFSTMTVMALIGALLTLAPRPLYPAYPQLTDQQLAGLLMWVPGTLPYLAAAVWRFARPLTRPTHTAASARSALSSESPDMDR